MLENEDSITDATTATKRKLKDKLKQKPKRSCSANPGEEPPNKILKVSDSDTCNDGLGGELNETGLNSNINQGCLAFTKEGTPRKRPLYRLYTKESLKEAIRLVKVENVPQRVVCQTLGIPRTTLHDHISRYERSLLMGDAGKKDEQTDAREQENVITSSKGDVDMPCAEKLSNLLDGSEKKANKRGKRKYQSADLIISKKKAKEGEKL